LKVDHYTDPFLNKLKITNC